MTLSEKISGTLHKLRYNNPFVNSYYRGKRKELLNHSFLQSKSYDDLMHKYADSNFSESINDAELKTDNFIYRHMRFHKVLGCWRWKGLWQYKNEILPLIFDEKLKGIDFGGANGPVSLSTTIVDFAKKDSFNREVQYNSLDDIDFKLDFVFSSHTLEHIEKLDEVLQKIKSKLKVGAKLVFLVPSYSCKRWNSGVHTNKAFNDHAWTFYLSESKPDGKFENLSAIDKVVGEHFNLKIAKYVGDNSILIIATND